MFHQDELSSSYSIALWLEIVVSNERYFLQLTFTEKTLREFMQNIQEQCLLKECCMLSCVGIYVLFTLEDKINFFCLQEWDPWQQVEIYVFTLCDSDSDIIIVIAMTGL